MRTHITSVKRNCNLRHYSPRFVTGFTRPCGLHKVEEASVLRTLREDIQTVFAKGPAAKIGRRVFIESSCESALPELDKREWRRDERG